MPRGFDGLDIAVVGTGIAGMSAAWLLSQAHRVTVYEAADRLGGHSHTVSVPGPNGPMPVDMGFIVYNEPTYPNLTALFRHLGVPTQPSDMSFAVSLRDGAVEYAGTDLRGLFAQKRNLLRPRFWSMLRDLVRFYREAPRDAGRDEPDLLSLGAYLSANRYGAAFIEDHLLPMAAAIWSTPADRVAEYPVAAFVRFCENHGLLRIADRPVWRTVTGGSAAYVARLTSAYSDRTRLRCGANAIRRSFDGVYVLDAFGVETRYDHVVIASHSDEALALLVDPSPREFSLLGSIRYGANEAVMHRDPSLMPRRRQVWSSWNYLGDVAGTPCVTYWMNRLQGLPGAEPVFMTLNPPRQPAPETVLHRASFTHPRFDAAAMQAQRELWSLQGGRRTWYCGAYFGAGFHEDGLQAGLAVAEALGGVRRPWNVAGESSRIQVGVSTV